MLELPIEAAGESLRVALVSMGNPHAVTFVSESPENFDLARIGPAVEQLPVFTNRTNFEVVRVLSRTEIEMRVWERGAGETLACGTGASASVVAARLRGFVDGAVDVRVRGGTLRIEWDGEGEVYLSGSATHVFSAQWGAQWETPDHE